MIEIDANVEEVAVNAKSKRPCPVFVVLTLAGAVHAQSTDAPPPVQSNAAATNDSNWSEPVDENASGDAILRAQVLLDRAHFSPGEIDGVYGSSTRNAITAYQNANGMTVTGTVDAATWAKLNVDTAAIESTYTITADDVAGPFANVPNDMMAKSRLKALSYGSVIEALGEKFHASPNLLRQLNAGKNFDRAAGEEIVVPNVGSPAPLPPAAKVVVDRSDASVSLFDAADKLLARFPATTGSEHDPLPTGDWVIQSIDRNPVFHYNPALFWDANPTHSKADIAAGPNNPVGVVWVGLSKEHYGIHGTPEPAKIGKTQSHGCIRLTNWDATTLADAVTTGMPAVLQE